ncbi:MAG: AAA family ATPase [Dechloromonas sp.]|jgi:DNA transposition AAA+ family ATPase|nr:AAA family ATPase [Dechloromonas sp.]
MIDEKYRHLAAANPLFSEGMPKELREKGDRGKMDEWRKQQLQLQIVEEDKKNAVLDAVRARLAAGTISLPRLQVITGLDASDLKGFVDLGMTSGINAFPKTSEAFENLASWLAAEEVGPEDDAACANTPTFKALQNLFAAAHERRELIAITGSWGIGKTQAAKYYAATHPRTYNRPGAVRIQFDRTDCKPVAALEKIRDAIGANPGSHRRGNTMEAIGATLRPGDFLILEECQRLGEALDVIPSLYDDFGIGIAMIGNPDLSTTVWGKKSTFGALASRANRFDFPATTPDDVDAWLVWHGLPDVLSGQERAKLARCAAAIATRPGQNGGLRALADVIRMAENLFGGQRLTGDLLSQLAAQMKPGLQ